MYAAVVLAKSAAKLAQSAASYGEEVSEGLSQQWAGLYPHSGPWFVLMGRNLTTVTTFKPLWQNI